MSKGVPLWTVVNVAKIVQYATYHTCNFIKKCTVENLEHTAVHRGNIITSHHT